MWSVVLFAYKPRLDKVAVVAETNPRARPRAAFELPRKDRPPAHRWPTRTQRRSGEKPRDTTDTNSSFANSEEQLIATPQRGALTNRISCLSVACPYGQDPADLDPSTVWGLLREGLRPATYRKTNGKIGETFLPVKQSERQLSE